MKLRKNKNKRLIKEAMKFYPFDYGFVLSLEKQALIRMYEYFKVSRIAEGNEVVEKNLKLALGLLDIVLEIDSAYHCDFRPGSEGFVDRHINIKNWKRFWPKAADLDLSKPILQDHLRREKAWYLYNKLRFERMRTWCD